jgi:hypothetical protein
MLQSAVVIAAKDEVLTGAPLSLEGEITCLIGEDVGNRHGYKASTHTNPVAKV